MASPSATPGARTADTLSAIRQEFPGATKWVYLDTAARGLLSTRVRRAVDRYLDERTYEGGDKSEMFATVERVRKRFAALVGADPDEAAFTKSVAEGLNAVAAAFPWRDGDNVVVCPDLEHPSNVYPWLRLQRFGEPLRLVEIDLSVAIKRRDHRGQNSSDWRGWHDQSPVSLLGRIECGRLFAQGYPSTGAGQ